MLNMIHMGFSKIVESRTTPLKEWVKQKYGDSKKDHFYEWWNNEMKPVYNDVYFEYLDSIKCSYFHKLLFEDNEFFEKIQEYMTKCNWTWSGDKTSPSIEDMKNNVLELSCNFNVTKKECNISSSGGFEVHFYPKKYLKVLFMSYDTDRVIYEKNVDITDIRSLKLNRLVYES